MKQKFKKLKKFLPKKLQTQRAAYFGMALLIIFSIFTYDIFFRSPKVKAATIGSSSDSSATGTTLQRHLVISSNGVQVAFYNAGTSSPTGIVYSISTDNGSTWGTVTQVNSTSTNDFSVVIDRNDNIHLAYSYQDISGNPIIGYQKLSRTTPTSWSVGSTSAVSTGAACDIGGGNLYGSPVIALNSANKIYISFWDETIGGGFGPCTGSATYSTDAYTSTNGTSWTSIASLSGNTNASLAGEGTSIWLLKGVNLYVDIGSTGNWSSAGTIISTATNVSMSYGLDALHFLFNATNQVEYQTYSISSGTFSSATVISSSANDIAGQISTDSQNVWAVWQQYVGANSYNVVYKRYNGSTWDSSATSITTDNLNNTHINTAAPTPNSANVPMIWTTGTSSPYSVKASTFSSIGSVTDTGNQTGSMTGSLTGSSGDTIVKCGIWYYNTVNVVSGMTVKVCSSNGQTGGQLIIYANSVTVSGSIDGAGRGQPGGVNIYGVGGSGGNGDSTHGGGGTGQAGTSTSGSLGSGAFGGSGGSAGTNATGGATGGAAGSFASSQYSGGVHGLAGNGTASGGSNGALGGFLGAGINGDTSTDESMPFSSSGGAGGTGGSGAGGGGGGMGGGNANGFGGQGAIGAKGGYGGKGGNAGAIVRIYTAGNLTVSGSILITGQAGTSGAAGQAGSAGGGGAAACDPLIC